MIIEREAVDLAEVAGFGDAQDDAFQKAIELSKHLLRRHLVEVPRTDSALDGLEQRVFSDALQAAEHKGVVDFVLRPLDAMRAPFDDVICVIGIDFVDVVEPPISLGGVAGLDGWRPIEIENRDVFACDPTAFRDQAIAHDHGQAGCPGHLFDRPIAVEPRACQYDLLLAVVAEHWLAGGVDQDNWRHACIDTGGRPQVSRRRVDVSVLRHVREEIVERYTVGVSPAVAVLCLFEVLAL